MAAALQCLFASGTVREVVRATARCLQASVDGLGLGSLSQVDCPTPEAHLLEESNRLASVVDLLDEVCNGKRGRTYPTELLQFSPAPFCNEQLQEDAVDFLQLALLHPLRDVKALEVLQKTTVRCLECKRESVTPQSFQVYSVTLPEKPGRHPASLCELLHNDMTFTETMTGINQYTCSSDSCGGKPRDALMWQETVSMPRVLMVQVKRFRFHAATSQQRKILTPTDVPLEMDVAGKAYTLRSVLVHDGKTVACGHYITYCRYGEEWRCYNDGKVVKLKNLVRAFGNFKADKTPYLFLFEERHPAPAPAVGAATPLPPSPPPAAAPPSPPGVPTSPPAAPVPSTGGSSTTPPPPPGPTPAAPAPAPPQSPPGVPAHAPTAAPPTTTEVATPPETPPKAAAKAWATGKVAFLKGFFKAYKDVIAAHNGFSLAADILQKAPFLWTEERIPCGERQGSYHTRIRSKLSEFNASLRNNSKTYGVVDALPFPPLKNAGLDPDLGEFIFRLCHSQSKTATRLLKEYFCDPKQAAALAKAAYDRRIRPRRTSGDDSGDVSGDSDSVDGTPPPAPAAASPGPVGTPGSLLTPNMQDPAYVKGMFKQVIYEIAEEGGGTFCFSPFSLKSERDSVKEEVLSDAETPHVAKQSKMEVDSNPAKRPRVPGGNGAAEFTPVPAKRRRRGKGESMPVKHPRKPPLTSADFDKRGPAEAVVVGFENGHNGADPRPVRVDPRLEAEMRVDSQKASADGDYKARFDALFGSLPGAQNPELRTLQSGFQSGTAFQDVWRAGHVGMWRKDPAAFDLSHLASGDVRFPPGAWLALRLGQGHRQRKVQRYIQRKAAAAARRQAVPKGTIHPEASPSYSKQQQAIVDRRKAQSRQTRVKAAYVAAGGEVKRGARSAAMRKKWEDAEKKVDEEDKAKKKRESVPEQDRDPGEGRGRRDGICRQLSAIQEKLRAQYLEERETDVVHPLVGKSLRQIVEEGRTTFNWDEACKGRVREVTGLSEWQVVLLYDKYKAPNLFTPHHLLLTLHYLRRKPIQRLLTAPFSFDMDGQQAMKYVDAGVDHLVNHMNEVQNVQDSAHSDPYNHAPLFPAVTHLLDVTYIPTSRGGVGSHNMNYSKYYGRDVVKLQVAVNCYGLVSYISGPHPGATADSCLWGTSKESANSSHPNLDGHHVVMGDGAYADSWRCVIASRRVGGNGDENRVGPLQHSVLSSFDCKEYDGAHNLIRMRVERAIARLKVFRILTYPWLRTGSVDVVKMSKYVSLVANVHNFMCKYALPELPVGPYPNKVYDFVPGRGEAPVHQGETEGETQSPTATQREGTDEDEEEEEDADEDDDDDDEFGLGKLPQSNATMQFPEEAAGGDDVLDDLLRATRNADVTAEWHDM